MLTQERSSDFVDEAFNAGATGYVSKMSAAEDLSAAIVNVSQGMQFLSPCLTQLSGFTPNVQKVAV
jgi:DNA-binding NarL/FixJ family response regulator